MNSNGYSSSSIKENNSETTTRTPAGVLKSAIFGAMFGAAFILIEGCLETVPAIFTDDETRTAAFSHFWAMLVSGMVAGAVLGAAVSLLPRRGMFRYLAFPFSGAVAGMVLWLLVRPDTGMAIYAIVGALVVSTLFILEGRGSSNVKTQLVAGAEGRASGTNVRFAVIH